MPNTVIDSKSDTRTFRHFPIKETLTTTINLLELSANNFGLNYQVDYTGTKSGTLTGGPIAIPGNGSYTENDDPKVVMIVSNYSDSGTSVSMQLTITVDVPFLGTVTIFDQTMGGKYGIVSLAAIVKQIGESAKS